MSESENATQNNPPIGRPSSVLGTSSHEKQNSADSTPTTPWADCCNNRDDSEKPVEMNPAGQNFQGPHDWRKRLKPVKSPIKDDGSGMPNQASDGKDNVTKSRPLPPWKRDLIERNKKVARLVRRESSGRSKRTQIVRRDSSGRGKKPAGSESPSGIGRRRSFRNNSMDSAFTQQVVNENSGIRRRISPANSFKSSSGVRRTPSDKVLDPSDPNTKKRVERVRRARLYLLQQMGPNSFLIVGDSPEHKFKVIIGPQTCTCGKGPHCVHVLFVMLRVFQVSESDPCLWSRQLKNYEVENLFRIYNDKRNLKIEAKKAQRCSKPSPNTSRVPSPVEVVPPADSDAGSVREEDDTCPICLLEMLEGESLLKCGACQNKLHHHCITVWFEECRRQVEPLICPLCRAWWKENKGEEASTDPPIAPPNTRVPSPHQEPDNTRLPYAEQIPGEYINLATPWSEVLGEDLVSCFFSRNWSIRESGLKHLAREMARELNIVNRNLNSGGSSLEAEESRMKLLGCCFKVVAFMCQDPVYRVFVGCLKVLRTVFGVVPSRDYHQRDKLQTLFKPVMDAIIVKCTDGNRRTGELSISTILELAKGQHGELAVGRDMTSPGELGLGGLTFLVSCLTEKCNNSDVSWQWLLGRLYSIERLMKDCPTEFLPRQRPDGASSESSLELMGATSDDEERPQNYDRLLTVAEFAVKAVSNCHARISRVAKRVFLLAARYAAHLDSLVKEFFSLLNELDFAHKKSLKRQLEKIVADFQLSEQLGQHVHVQNIVNGDRSPDDSVNITPLSSPKCVSPVTVLSDIPSESGSITGSKNLLLAPPNTPIRNRHVQKSVCLQYGTSLEAKNDEDEMLEYGKLKSSKSLDDLDSVVCKPRGRASKLPLTKKMKSRSTTPQRVRPVLETNLDEVIRLEEEAKQRKHSVQADHDDSAFENDASEILNIIDPPRAIQAVTPTQVTPQPRLLSHDLETDIDSVDLDIDLLFRKSPASAASANEVQYDEESGRVGENAVRSDSTDTPKLKHSKIPKNLALDLSLSPSGHQKLKRSISPCAHVTEFQRICNNNLESSSDHAGQNPTFQRKSPGATARKSWHVPEKDDDASPRLADCSGKSSTLPSNQRREKLLAPDDWDSYIDHIAMTPCSGNEEPVSFKTEVAMATPKHSPSHTVQKDEDCPCKEEVEKEEALALAKAMEISSMDPPKPVVPGLTPLDQEVITIRIQPDNCDDTDCNGNPPPLYYENVHWAKGSLLGTGAFSSCYQARDIQTGTIMALKQISFCRNSRSEQENVIETITEEIHMMAKLNHPHIVRILGATRQGCHFNMFVEWMPGGSVASLLGQYGKFSEQVITNYALQVLRGLAYLHDNQILHRDLKGANLLVDSTGQRLRIGDFGAAARLASKATGAGEFQGQLLGTIAFMAPEVLRGENYGRVCDVWSVGCCLIEMATTKPPWNAHDISNHLALIFKIANAQSTPPIPEKLSPPLRDLMLRCLEPVKDQRPSAKELLIHPLFTQYMSSKRQ